MVGGRPPMATNFSDLAISGDGTHHTFRGLPAYERRFCSVMSFHDPGVAAVRDETGAYHIDTNGDPIYDRRFKRAFGFYGGLATVEDDTGWYHIDSNGRALYADRYCWAGNFQEGLCTVRDCNGDYFHIKGDGSRAYTEKYAYAGDYRYGIASVYLSDGCVHHIDKMGRVVHGGCFLELGPFHKGFAVARDESGYFHVDMKGRELYGNRYQSAEPFYNGFAFCRDNEGRMVLVDESGIIAPLKIDRSEDNARSDLAQLSHIIYERGYNCSVDGNVSCRIGVNRFLITPAAKHKGFISSEDFVVIDDKGKILQGKGEPSSEYRLHLAVYEARQDINVVLHVHAPYSTALSLAGIDLLDGYITIKPVPTVPFAMPSSAEGAAKIREFIGEHKVMILERHGVLSSGKNIWDALARLEAVENASKIVLSAIASGNTVKPFTGKARDNIFKWWKLPDARGPS
jgi:ribulose-5-phosphate 4-epimerase/fuculose-1-phosphate aldolase